MGQPDFSRRNSLLLLLILSILAGGVAIAGYRYYLGQRRTIETEVQHQLASIADLKVRQIVSWRQERLGEARVILQNELLMPALGDVLQGRGNGALRRRVLAWMRSLETSYQYANVVLVDPDGEVRLYVGPPVRRLEHLRQVAAEARRANDVVFSDFHEDTGALGIHLGLNIPLRMDPAGPVVGVLLLGIDPNRFLYPLLESWPTPSRSAETLLVRREDDTVLFLNDPLFRKQAALKLRLPLRGNWQPAVQGSLGYEGVTTGPDYRGVPVVAAIRRVPDSPWIMVAKVDADEIYAPIRQRAVYLAWIVGALIAATAAGAGMVWRHQRARFYAEQLESEWERQALVGHYCYLTRYANDIVLLMDEDGRFIEVNDRAVATYGYSREELRSLTVRQLRAPAALAAFESQWQQAATPDGAVFETLHQRKDGSVIPVEVSARVIEVQGRNYRQEILRDITERKKAENELRGVNRALRVLSQFNQAMVRSFQEESLLQEACRTAVELGGYRLAWVGFAQQNAGKSVTPVCSVGDEAGYLSAVKITWGDDPSGQGPVGRAICSGQPVISNNLDTDPKFALWKAEAQRHGLGSCVALPLKVGSRVIGALVIYAAETDAFDSEELTLLGEIAGGLAFGIDAARTRVRHDRAFAELRDAEEKFRTIFHGNRDAIFIRYEDGPFVEVNEAACLYLGYSREELLHMRPSDLETAECRETANTRLERLRKQGHALSEVMNVRKDGTQIPVEVSARLIEFRGAPAIVSTVRDVSERCRMLQSLHEAKARYQAIVEQSTSMICRFDRSGSLTFVNNAYCQYFGKTRQKLIGCSHRDMIFEEDRDQLPAPEQVPDDTPPRTFEIRVNRADGQVRWNSWSVQLISGGDDGPVEFQAVGQDVTERKGWEAALRESERRYRQIVETAQEGVWTVDAGHRTAFVNRRFAEMLGYGPREMIGRPALEFMGEDASDHVWRQLEECREDETGHHDLRLRRKDGSRLWVTVSVSPQFDAGGRYAGATAMVTDISARRRIEEELRESRERLEMAFEAAEEGLWDENLRTGSGYQSPRYSTMLGYKQGEIDLAGGGWLDLVHPDDRSMVEGVLRDYSAGVKDSNVMEIRMRAKSGQYVWVLSRGKVVERDADGKPARIVGTHVDITERKKLEEQLRHVQKLESVGRLAGGIAHDFNNLLTVINGYADLLLGGLGALDPLRSQVAEILKAGERAAALTHQLLAFSRKQLVQPRLLDLNTVARDAERMLCRLIRDDIELATSLSPSLGLVRVDPGQIHQLLLNLAVNARDAMPDGGTLTIETANVTLGADAVQDHPGLALGAYIVLAVSDTGTGMSEEVKSHLFEPFFTTKEQGSGTGLGLATVYGIAKQNGGGVWVYSEPGMGTTFKIYLPRVQADAGAADGPLAPAALPLRGVETILLVEDQEDVRQLAAAVLHGFGYRVLQAANPSEALLLSEQFEGPIHLMLTDLVMPGISGKQLADRLQPLRPEMKVLFMSGYTDDAIVRRGVLDAGIAFLQKPFSPDQLGLKVREVLGFSKAAQTVLVVDDESGIRSLLSQVLRRAGYEAVEAADGKEALAQIEGRKIDLVLTDLAMPGQEGIETIEILHHTYPHVKIVAMSGAFGGDILRAAQLLGAHATLHKPIHQEELLRAVRALLQG